MESERNVFVAETDNYWFLSCANLKLLDMKFYPGNVLKRYNVRASSDRIFCIVVIDANITKSEVSRFYIFRSGAYCQNTALVFPA